MIPKPELKKQLLLLLLNTLDQKIAEAKAAITSARESRDSETKSSMGDKYETTRAMVQIEIEKSEMQLNKALESQTELTKINLDAKPAAIGFGSIVCTNHENYFIAIGVGKINFENSAYYAISLNSPIGRFLNGKVVGNTGIFQERSFKIIDIL